MIPKFKRTCDYLKDLAAITESEETKAMYLSAAAIVWAIGEVLEEKDDSDPER